MNVAIFDFDHTIYRKNTIIEFTKYIYKKKPFLYFFLFIQAFYGLLFFFRIISAKTFKETFLGYINFINKQVLNNYIIDFWDIEYPKNFRSNLLQKIQSFTSTNVKTIIISAAPDLLIAHLQKKINVDYIFATTFELYGNNVKIIGENCRGPEKIKRLQQNFNVKKITILEAYSDNKDDRALLNLAQNGFIIRNDKVILYEPNKK